jgi:hypothetical protein
VGAAAKPAQRLFRVRAAAVTIARRGADLPCAEELG